MPITLDFAPILQRVNEQTLILTPNARTQKAISAGFVSALEEGEVVYAPTLKSFSQWQSELWQEFSFVAPLPSIVGNLELKTWLKDQIAADEKWQLTNELGVAEKVLEGYRTLTQWNLTLADLQSLDTLENQYFVRWVTALEEFLKETGLIPQFAVGSHLLKLMAKDGQSIKDLLPKKILLVSFNQLTPCESALLKVCENSGVEIESFYPTRFTRQRTRVEFQDLNQEIAFAARLTARLALENPEKSIGIVVNQLANYLPEVHQYFSESFQPDEALPWQPLEKIKYNVSAGESLADHPMVSLAIKILQLKTGGFDLETLRLLKNTPFIDWGKHAYEIRSFLHSQSLLGYRKYSLDRLVAAIEKSEDKAALELLKKRITSLQIRPSAPRPMNAWVDWWRTELSHWGWLKNYQMDQCETKLYSEFQAALNECLNLARVYSRSNQAQAKEYLMQVLRQTPFQLPSDRTNVHVLGVLEATGLEFDDLLLVGFNRNNWPGKAKLNPFLPVAFQQQHKMPGSSAEREYEYTEDLTHSLLNSAEQIWVTQSRLEDGLSGESPLFAKLPLNDASEYSAEIKTTGLTSDYRWLMDEQVDIPLGDIRGGAYLLSYYASCPFKAMSNFQFNIRPAQQAQSGIDARVKGSWLHRALELLWLQLIDQRALKALSESELSTLIRQVLDESREELMAQLLATAAAEIITLESEKLYRQIWEWLELEKQRAHFSVSTEVEKELTLGPLNFRFRVDRMDINEKGNIEIIDYKSGQTDVKKWLGERPDEAQMPAYVLACKDQKVESLSYAKIKTGEVARSGLWFNEDTSSFRFLEIDLQGEKDKTRSVESMVKADCSMTEQWQFTLNNLAEKISQGVMPVSPKSLIESCRYCDFASFCRINELQSDTPITTVSIDGSEFGTIE